MKSLIIAVALAVSSASTLAGPAPVKLGGVIALDKSASTTSLAEITMPSSTDEARAEAAKRHAAAARIASLQPYVHIGPGVVSIIDTDSARRAAERTNQRRGHEAHLADVLRVGSGLALVSARVTDSDSARAVAGRAGRARDLRQDYEFFVRMFGKPDFERSGATVTSEK
jgi:hypothetical protein